jgi:hypothetical protein
MSEIELGIGRSLTQTGGLQREVLSWYDRQENRDQTAEEILEEQQRLLNRYRQQFGNLPEG